MSRSNLLWVALMLTMAMTATFVLTAPNAGTQAKWSDAAQITTPGMSMGQIRLGIGASTGGRSPTTTVSNTSGFGLEYAPSAVTLQPRPNTPTTAADATAYAGISSIAYYTGTASCATAATGPRWSTDDTSSTTKTVSGSPARMPLTDGASQQLCATARTGLTDRDLLLRSAGRQFQLNTTVHAASVAPGSWSATQPWTVNHTVPFPTPTLKSCARGTNAVTLQWAWPDDATTTAPGNTTTHASPAVSRWEILVWNETTSRWVKFGEAAPQLRWNRFPTANVPGFTWSSQSSYYITVRAYPFAGNDNYFVTSPTAYRVTRSSTTYTCGSLYGGSPVPTVSGYDPGELE